MLRCLNYKHISTALTVIFFIIIVYAINSMNQTALIVSIIILVLNIFIETIWILKRRRYKTVYWIALANLVNIFCMIAFIVLLFTGKNLTDTEQIINHILLGDKVRIAFYVSLILSSFLKSEVFKVSKDLSDHGSGDGSKIAAFGYEREIAMNIELKTRTRSHVLTFWDETQDEEIRKLFPSSIMSKEEALILFDESLKGAASSYGKVIYFEGRYIGDIWCYSIDESDEKMAMLSTVIFDKKMWGKGIGTEAARTFLDEIFNKYNIEKVGAFTYSNNYASIGLLEKVGFVEIEKFIENGVESRYFEIAKDK